MPFTFSCIDSFRASYFLNTFLNNGIAWLITIKRPNPSTGIVRRKTSARRPPMYKAITKEKMIIRGLRKARRISIMYASCTFVTSVVILVTRDEVENLSMFSKEYV